MQAIHEKTSFKATAFPACQGNGLGLTPRAQPTCFRACVAELDVLNRQCFGEKDEVHP